MELPPIDHAGWTRLLSAVMAETAGAATPVVELRDESEAQAAERALRARLSVHETSPDVYA